MKRYKTGFFAGTFDVFRRHHLEMLMRAKALCENLFVGIYTDETVAKATQSKPLIPFCDRCQIVESIRYVDQVFPLMDDDFSTIRHQYPFEVVFNETEEENMPQDLPELQSSFICHERTTIPDDHQVVGYTTGTYDLFHIGHLNVIRRAKELCDYLIVGVSTDELVASYKHHQPVYRQDERMEIIGSLKYVDQVIEQKTLDKMDVWKELHFNKLFHGDDWKGSSLYNRIEEDLKTIGCEIVYLPHTEGVSSSNIRSHIKQSWRKNN